ncbi:MAG: hypothetical protein HQM10_14820 [Candidatus Riflebacteria bacterium]|nr:hypothetical protein [Candidatus Riflebacteria bacterium]
MSISLSLYKRALSIAVGIFELFPPRRVDRQEIQLRKGIFELSNCVPASGTIWVHGASLGETLTLKPLMKRLNRRYGPERLLATATTTDGLKQIRRDALAGHSTLLPVELPEILDTFIDKMNPRLLLINETEIWPLLASHLARRGIPSGIINGRINKRTVRFLNLFKKLFQDSISALSFVFVQSQIYSKRFESIGISEKRIKVLGSFKFDYDCEDINPESVRSKFGLSADKPVLVLGSTHSDEEKTLIEALSSSGTISRFQLVVVPRHLQRIEEVRNLLAGKGFQIQLSSEISSSVIGNIILVNQQGCLKKLYSVADLAFVGGSLIPRGGHNMLEPAAFSVPVITGPHTGNFTQETSRLKENEALITASNAGELSRIFSDFFNDREKYRIFGMRAESVLKKLAGATDRTIDSLQEMSLLPR